MMREFLVGIACAILAELLGDWLTWLSRWLTKIAARGVPRKHRSQWEADWLADLEFRPRFTRLYYALGLFRAARSIRGEYWTSIRVRRPLSPFRLSPGSITAKRAFDIVLALVVLILFAPLMAVVAIGVKLSSPGPVLFRQRRYGPNGEEIYIYKFRSMRVYEDGATVVQATRNDFRVTRFGRFLRRTSMDDLPQIMNVLQGKMSLVGPRPVAVAHNKEYRKVIAARRWGIPKNVRPGITGWAQINGYTGEVSDRTKILDRAKHDLDYLKNWSLWLDVKIVVRTLLLLLRDNSRL
jgi:lipopolysaccharide/colanic/teichoic acid biosynthesis glycosyltransferase